MSALETAAPERPTIIVLDDDASMRQAVGNLLRSVGWDVVLIDHPAALERIGPAPGPSCLVLDVRLRGQSGLEVQAKLARAGIRIPVVFITGHGDIPMTVRAMKAGAVDFLTKPFRDQDLLDAVSEALERDRRRREDERSRARLAAVYDTLTVREREVMRFVVRGLLNKQIAAELGLSEITVKVDRGNLMRKMGTRSLAELVRVAAALEEDLVEPA